MNHAQFPRGIAKTSSVEISSTQPSVLTKAGVAIRMNGKGAWRDNVFVEQLWRTVKYEEIYFRAYDSVSEARASIARYLDDRTPDEAYFGQQEIAAAA